VIANSEAVRVHDHTADAQQRLAAATVTGAAGPAPSSEVLAEPARRALDEAWAADWGHAWMKAIWHAAAAERRRPRAGAATTG
jgi:hypothetical protein